MEYNFKGKGISITTPMQDAVISSLSILDRYLDPNTAITMTVEKEGHKVKVTIRFYYEKETIKISDVGEDYYATLDTLADIVKVKMERLHDRSITKKHNEQLEQIQLDEKDGNETIVTRKFVESTQLTEQKAIEKMKELGHPTFIFENADMDGETCLIYKRQEGNYGILQCR